MMVYLLIHSYDEITGFGRLFWKQEFNDDVNNHKTVILAFS